MARSARNRAPRRKTKWLASTRNALVSNTTLLAASDGLPLAAGTDAVNDQADPTIVGVRGQISISRQNANDVNPAIAWAIVLMRTNPSTPNVPIQIFNPFDQDDLERQDILGMGHVPAPPENIDTGNTGVPDSRSNVVDVHIKAKRKYARNTNGLFFWIVGDNGLGVAPIDGTFRVIASFRTLLMFG